MTHQRGRPSAIAPDIIDYIEMLSLANAKLTDGEIAALVNQKFDVCISSFTISRKIKELGFVYRPPLAIQALTEEHKNLRLEFCKWVVENESKI